MIGFNTRKPESEKAAPSTTRTKPKAKKRTGIFKNMATGKFLATESTIKSVPFFLFLATIGMLYIGNNFYTERTIRKSNHLKKELKELRFEYIATKSQYSDSTKQSKVARRLAEMGIQEAVRPPEKIFVKQRELTYP